MRYIIITALFALTTLLTASNANATFVSFNSTPTNTTYLSDGLLLGSGGGGYRVGGCGNRTAGSNGCLGDSTGFRGDLTFTFVENNTTTQAVTDSFEIILCEGCAYRGTTAQVFDAFGVLMTSINMNTGYDNRTFSFAAAGIGSIFVDLGNGSDAVQSLQFGDIYSATAAVPESGTLSLLGIGLLGFGMLRRRRKAA